LETSEVRTLVLSYRRMKEKRGDEYPYNGKIEVRGLETNYSESFVGWDYKRIIVRLHQLLLTHDAKKALFQRTERDDLMPVELGERLLHLLRVDPLSAYRAMLYESAPAAGSQTAIDDVITGSFGEVVYLRMANGRVEDPETGAMLSLGYGPQSGWRVRRNDNNSGNWIPIQPVDDAPDGTSFAERLAFFRWARVKVQDLLAQKLERYYLPRAWNEKGPWISHMELSSRLESHLAGKKRTTCP